VTIPANDQRFREFRMPDVGEGLTEAEILKWHVQPGDSVTDGQVVCEVETAKAAVELPVPFNGTVSELRFDEGTTVDVGAPIIVVDTGPGAGDGAGSSGAAVPAGKRVSGPAEGEAGPEGEAAAGAGGEDGRGERKPVLVGYGVSAASAKRRPRKPRPDRGVPARTAQAAGPDGAAAPRASAPTAGRPLAKPPVRKLAKDLGIELAAVTPTGPDGVITREDVHAAAAPEPAPVPAPVQESPESAPSVEPQSMAAIRERRVPVKGVRKVTAAAMVSSAFTAPHVTEFVTCDVTRTMRLVQSLKDDPEMAGLRVNPLLLVAKALLVAIRRNPEVNAAWDEEAQEIVYKNYVNLGIATATPRGLIVPNIKDAHAKTLPELSRAMDQLISTAREGRTAPAGMRGGTVTITNIGIFGVDTGTPLLNPGESAILAFGAVRDQPWVHKGKVKPRKVTTLALSFDHRLVDGELGSRVLADVAAVLEHPKRLITWT
jgi:2-oxoisovalerate dehydrogenase E2 component (dihydrolipoyl transacylase)